VDSLRGEFVNEVNAQAEEMNNAARPFGRFVETSIGKSQEQLEKLTEIRGQIKEYQSKLE
jgi:methyl-accepting chemotaxis protein